MTRLPDWETRLAEHVAATEAAGFHWGVSDCATFAAGAVLALTAVNPFASIAGLYSTRLGGAARIRGQGFQTLGDYADVKLCEKVGAVEIDPAFALAGDIGVTADDALCVRLATGFVALRVGGGLGAVIPVRAWAIGW